MDQGENRRKTGDYPGAVTAVYRHSWWEYVRSIPGLLLGIFVIYLALSGIIYLLKLLLNSDGSVAWINTLFIVLDNLLAFFVVIGLPIVNILAIRSVRIFADGDGIWMDAGIFPWSSGRSGVKWRDLDEAVMTMGFAAWALKSYNITLRHRFTKDNEIAIRNVHNGDRLVCEINDYHMKLYQNRAED